MTWLCQPIEDDIHVMPQIDLREHHALRTCWCQPTEDQEEPAVWIHHALDGREKYETGELKLQ